MLPDLFKVNKTIVEEEIRTLDQANRVKDKRKFDKKKLDSSGVQNASFSP